MDEIIDRFSIDGVVFASNRSCKPYSLMQIDLMRHVKSRHDVPAVMIDVDHADMRKYSEENVFVKLEALIEEIDANRSA
jgi:benzoyl-CoA reductase/2-hydroxyglutaryl-CoA dehydratase subunit BcrC/BadD/HgdB